LISCSESYTEQKTLIKSYSKILKKETGGFKVIYYRIYIFDGETADWYDVESDLYNSINEGDSISTITLKIIRYEKKTDVQQVIN
jgi:hypothetical protein